jgi:uncharacterized protein (DUF849 family)
MAEPVIVTCAVTGGADTVGKHPAIPVTPEQIATAAIEAAKAGAAIAHIHVRDPKTGRRSMALELYREVVERIREGDTDVVINLTTGPGGQFDPSDNDPNMGGPDSFMATPENRVAHVQKLRPEICSLDIATMNFGERVFMNVPRHLAKMAKAIREAGVKPELEVFDSGQVRLARKLIDDGALDGASPLFQLCLGIPWGAPASTDGMIFMKSLLPPNSTWAGFGISSQEMPMVAQAVLLGGHVRVGLEDNLYIERGKFAPNNAALVEKAVAIVRALGREPATPAQARELLGVEKRG